MSSSKRRRDFLHIAGFAGLGALLAVIGAHAYRFHIGQFETRNKGLMDSILPFEELRLDAWLNERRADIAHYAASPHARTLLSELARNPSSPQTRRRVEAWFASAQAAHPEYAAVSVLRPDGETLWASQGAGAFGLPAAAASAARGGAAAFAPMQTAGGKALAFVALRSGPAAAVFHVDITNNILPSLGGLVGLAPGAFDLYLARSSPDGAEVLDHDPEHLGRLRLYRLPPGSAVAEALRSGRMSTGPDHFGKAVVAAPAGKDFLGWRPIGIRELGTAAADSRQLALVFGLLGAIGVGGAFLLVGRLVGSAEAEAETSRQALGVSRRLLDKVTSTLPTGIFIFEPARLAFTYMTPAVERLFGFSAGEIRARGDAFLRDRIHPDDAAAFAGTVARDIALKDGEVALARHRFRVRSGDYRWLRGRTTVFERGPDGRATLILGSVEDCTEEVVARDALIAALARAKMLTQAIENAAESIVITDPAGVIQYLNPAAERASGYRSSEAVGRHTRLLQSGRQDKAFYQDLWDTILRGQVWHGTFVNKRKDGSLYEEEASIAPVKDESGRVTNFVAVKRDISRERSLEDQLAQAQKLEAVGRLAGGVAHDFNNILTSLLGYAQLAKDVLSDDDPIRSDLDEIEKGARRAADLTRQLLIFSRKQVIQPRLIDPSAVVGALQKMLHRIIGEHYKLVFTAASSGSIIKADPSQLEQVVMNFVVNSRDAMPDGGEIQLMVRDVALSSPLRGADGPIPAGRYSAISVKDHGCGIPAEALEHIFEPFFTTKPAGQGTGLGLATVYGIVKQGGAHLSVDTAPGEGTRMTVYWPLSAEAAQEEEAPPERSRGGSEAILLVEDEPAVRRLSERLLTWAGYSVTSCADPEEALAKATGAHRLLFTDVVMPHMSGKELAQRLNKRFPRLKVLYTSGYSDEIVSKQGMLDPGAKLLQKPFAQEALFKAVREALDS